MTIHSINKIRWQLSQLIAPNVRRKKIKQKPLTKKRRPQKRYTKPGKIDIQEVFAAMGDGKLKYVSAVFEGVEVNLGTLNLRMYFHKGVNCTADGCKTKGAYFKVEKSVGPPHIIYSDWHLNLYATKDGNEVLMTKDHRYPRSKGGPDTLDNLDPMCTHCNSKKADKIKENKR